MNDRKVVAHYTDPKKAHRGKPVDQGVWMPSNHENIREIITHRKQSRFFIRTLVKN